MRRKRKYRSRPEFFDHWMMKVSLVNYVDGYLQHTAGTSGDSDKCDIIKNFGIHFCNLWWSVRIFSSIFKCFVEIRKCVSKMILQKIFYTRVIQTTLEPFHNK